VVSTLVFGELDWSPGPHKQAIGRARRPGQTKRVRAYFCTTDHGSDPVMLETLDVKSMQSQGLIEGGADDAAQPPPEQMTPERYAQIKRLAFRVVAQADRGLTARRTA
jgi:hypothetical protein